MRVIPPHCKPEHDRLATQCDITPVTFYTPIPSGTWCHYCGYLANTRDHIVPDSAGGSRAWWNLVPACQECNHAKADRQSCSCLFCLRAMALWAHGYRRAGASYRDKKNRHKANRQALAN